MLTRPSDDDSISENDDDEHETNNHRSLFVTQQVTMSDNQWPKKKSWKSTNRGEATLLEIERDETPVLDSNQNQTLRTKSVSIVNNKHQSRNAQMFSPDDLDMNTQPNNMQSSRTRTNVISSPIRTSTLPTNIERQKPTSKIPVRSNLPRSPVPTSINRRVQSSTNSNNKGAFHFFNSNDRPTQLKATITSVQDSPFVRISRSKQISSSAGHTSSVEDNRKRITNSDDDDDLETNNLKEEDLKIKLKEEKRNRKKTGELLHQLHDTYEQLLERYAQAENTIDQLRFQPKIFGDNTPRSNESEHTVHIIQQPKMNITNLRSSGVYHSTTDTPLSSIRPVPSTTTTTSARKSVSPTNSGTIESEFFDEAVPRKIHVQELTTPETYKLDLLIQTKTLCDKMKSFLTLMDTNQLSLAEQKQVYENIRRDYENLLKTCHAIKDANDLNDMDLDADLNKELEIMKQLLKEIVTKITQNLLGKSNNNSETVTQDGSSHSNESSVRSSLCNHNDLMDQYQKLLNAVNTRNSDTKDPIKYVVNGLETDSRQLHKAKSRQSSESDLFDHPPPTKSSQKPYVYISGDSDDEQQQQSNGIAPVPLMKGIESTFFEVDYIPSTSVNYHQQINEERSHIHGITATTKKKKIPNKQEHDNLENISRSKLKTKIEQKKITPTDGTRYSTSSQRTRANDYDSGIGTNSTAKFSRDSKLCTSTMDESHLRSLDEGQESISSASSSRSSGSGSTSPGSPYSKYTKRLDGLFNDNYRRKPSGHSESYPSDNETHITGSFDPLPQSSSYDKKMHRSNHNWKPQRTVSHHSHSTPFHRSSSSENYKMKSSRPLAAPFISSTNHEQRTSSTYPHTMYRSSLYINQAHTHRPLEQTTRNQSNNLYLDPQTGIVYRYESRTNQSPTRNYYQVKPSKELYRCDECGSFTTYHHRHHTNPPLRRVTTDVDDLGYESGNKRKNRRRRYLNDVSSSDNDSDVSSNYLEMIALNEAYDQAEKVQHQSRSLSRYITRQLRLVLASI